MKHRNYHQSSLFLPVISSLTQKRLSLFCSVSLSSNALHSIFSSSSTASGPRSSIALTSMSLSFLSSETFPPLFFVFYDIDTFEDPSPSLYPFILIEYSQLWVFLRFPHDLSPNLYFQSNYYTGLVMFTGISSGGTGDSFLQFWHSLM